MYRAHIPRAWREEQARQRRHTRARAFHQARQQARDRAERQARRLEFVAALTRGAKAVAVVAGVMFMLVFTVLGFALGARRG